MAGNSGDSLVKKLGIKEDFKLYVKNSPGDYGSLIGKIPDRTEFKNRLVKNINFIHLFMKSRSELSKHLPKAKEALVANGMIWVSWPKKTSKEKTDLTEDVIREMCLPIDLVDIKVCAINDIWSGLKLVVRKENRK